MPQSMTLDSLLSPSSPIVDIEGSLTTDLDLLTEHVVPALGLDTKIYSPIFRELAQYWKDLDMHKHRYVIYVMQVLQLLERKSVIKQPEEWLEVGEYLADATKIVYGDGSNKFITAAVSSIARSPNIQTKEQFRDAVDGLLKVVEPLRKIGVNGGIVYENVAPILEAHGHLDLSQL